ncbi:hypothetical protein EMIT07CA2_100042 [Brevibacillus sp. IT-7CA2]
MIMKKLPTLLGECINAISNGGLFFDEHGAYRLTQKPIWKSNWLFSVSIQPGTRTDKAS